MFRMPPHAPRPIPLVVTPIDLFGGEAQTTERTLEGWGGVEHFSVGIAIIRKEKIVGGGEGRRWEGEVGRMGRAGGRCGDFALSPATGLGEKKKFAAQRRKFDHQSPECICTPCSRIKWSSAFVKPLWHHPDLPIRTSTHLPKQ